MVDSVVRGEGGMGIRIRAFSGNLRRKWISHEFDLISLRARALSKGKTIGQ